MHHSEKGEKVEKTKNKNKLIKRISSLLCALVLLAINATPYYADTILIGGDACPYVHDKYDKVSIVEPKPDDLVLPDNVNNYPHVLVMKTTYATYCMYFDGTITMNEGYSSGDVNRYEYTLNLDNVGNYTSFRFMRSDTPYKWKLYDDVLGKMTANSWFNDADYPSIVRGTDLILYNNFDIYCSGGKILIPRTYEAPKYSSDLGYLQNVHMNTVFDDVPFGETTGEKWTSRWYYDQFSTTGIDLTSGDYMINYYQERWIVKGYGADDVVEKSDRYLLGTYIVQNGYIETYSEDIESTLQGQGYEEPGMLDLLWNKFITTHYYFQIVDAKNNQVGGVLHIYLTDDDGKFGVEHIGETLDDKGEYDDSGYKDFIEDDSITTDDVEQGFNELEQDNEQTLEEWLEGLGGFTLDGLDDMDGADNFSDSLKSYATQISNVTSGVGAMFSVLPPWVLGLLGIAFCCLFVLIVVKVARG